MLSLKSVAQSKKDPSAMEIQPPIPIKLTRDDNEEIEENKAKQSNHLIIEVKNSLNELLESPEIIDSEPSTELSIYKIPNFIRETNPTAFEPQLVSFGPYHHGKPPLQPMELEKRKAFHHFKTSYGLNVDSIVERVSSILDDLFGSYDTVEEEWTKNPSKFLHLMIVDGCFMVEFFSDRPTSIENMSADILRDMLLLENQLPMKLLEELYYLANQDSEQSEDLRWLVRESMGMEGDMLTLNQCHHILDMYKSSLLYPPMDYRDFSNKYKYNKTDPECQIIRPATQLREAGIKFETSIPKSLTNVSFNPKRGVLSLPPLTIDDDTESALLNVMAFEKLHMNAGSKVTSFVILMNNLIDEDRDVALLAGEKILANALGNDQDAADLFSLLGSGAAMDLDSHMVEVHKLVNKHCNQPWNERCASLKHDYFQSPWAMISFCAAILGFVLLILQFIYQILDYYIK